MCTESYFSKMMWSAMSGLTMLAESRVMVVLALV